MSSTAVSSPRANLPSIMGRPTVPEAPLRALSFTEAINTPASEFVTVPQTVPLPPTPSGILLNKFRFDQAPSDASETSPPHAQPIPISSPAAGTDSLATPAPIIAPVAGGHSAGLGQLAARLARVASPDGGSTDGASSTDGGGSSTAPSSTVGSPALKQAAFGPRSQSPTESVATLTLLSTPSSPHLRPLVETAAPTLHCKFAPLPKIDAVERPATRRNSSVHAQTPRTKYPDAHDEQFAIDLDDSSAAPSPSLPTNASLGLIAGASSRPGFPGTPSRRSSGSTSGRSSSPSPIRRSGSIASSRTHSPAMSRQNSTDGLNIHYIEGAGPRSGRSSSRERERSTSTSASDVLRAAAKEMGSSTSGSGRASPSIGVGLGFDPASHSPTLAPTSASTLLPPTAALSLNAATPDSAPSARRTVFVEPPIEDPDEADENEDSDEGVESDDEEDGDEDEEDAGREDDDEDDDDGEEDPSPETSSKTAMGAAVEVVHWHSAQSKK